MQEKIEIKTIRYMTWEELNRLNTSAWRSRRNAFIPFKRVDALDKTKNYPVVLAFPHNEWDMRCQVQLSDRANDLGLLDLSFSEYARLRQYTVREADHGGQ